MRRATILWGLLLCYLAFAVIYGILHYDKLTGLDSLVRAEGAPQVYWWLPLGATPFFCNWWTRLCSWLQKKTTN